MKTNNNNTTKKNPWIVTSANLQSDAIKLARTAVKNTALNYGLQSDKRATEAFYTFNSAVKRIFRQTATMTDSGWVNQSVKPIAEQIDELKADNERLFKVREQFPTDGKAYNQITEQIRQNSDSITDLYSVIDNDNATVADDALMECYTLLLENLGKDIANEIVKVEKRQRSYDRPIYLDIIYKVRKLVTEDIGTAEHIFFDESGDELNLLNEILTIPNFAEMFDESDEVPTVGEIIDVISKTKNGMVISEMMMDGYNTFQIASKIGISHQMVSKIRKTIIKNLTAQFPEFMEKWENRKTVSPYSSWRNKMVDNISVYSVEYRR